MAKTSKTTLAIKEIVEMRDKAVKVHLAGDDIMSAIWLPLHRVKLDEAAMTVTMSDKLADEKLADARKDYKAIANQQIELIGPAWESDKALGYDVLISLTTKHREFDRRKRIFLPKNMVKDNKAPGWLLRKKVEELFDFDGGHRWWMKQGLVRYPDLVLE